MTDPEREARRSAILSQIEAYTNVLNQLITCRDNISTTLNTIKEDVEDPITEPYDLSGNNEWQGKNYTSAKDDVSEIGSSLKSYRTNVLGVNGKIGEAITRLQTEIERLYRDLAALG